MFVSKSIAVEKGVFLLFSLDLTPYCYTQHESQARVVKQNDNATTVEFDIADDVTWLVFEAE